MKKTIHPYISTKAKFIFHTNGSAFLQGIPFFTSLAYCQFESGKTNKALVPLDPIGSEINIRQLDCYLEKIPTHVKYKQDQVGLEHKFSTIRPQSKSSS